MKKQPKRTSVLHKLFLWLFIALVALGQLQRVEVSSNVSVYLHEMILGVFALLVLLQSRGASLQCFLLEFNKPQSRSFNPFLLWIGISTLANAVAALDPVPMLYIVRLVLIIFGTYSILYVFRLDRKYVQFSALGLGALWAVLAILQFIFLPDTRFLHILGWDAHYFRSIGTFFDPAFLGMAMVLSFIAAQFTSSSKSMLGSFLLSSLFATVIALTYSRTSYLSFILASGVLLTLQFQKYYKVIVLSLLLAVLAVLVAPKPGGEGVDLTRTASITARTSQISNLVSTTSMPNLIFGSGLFAADTVSWENDANNQLGIPQHARVPDNIFLLIYQGSGLVGILLLTVGLWKSISSWWKNNPEFCVAASATILHSQFNNTLLHPFILLYFLLLFWKPTQKESVAG